MDRSVLDAATFLLRYEAGYVDCNGLAHIRLCETEPGGRSAGVSRHTIAACLRRIAAVAWPPVDVVGIDVRAVKPTPGAVVYFDPPYGTTTSYPTPVGAVALTRNDVVQIAQCWHAAGCVVGVSYGARLDELDGAQHIEMRAPIRGGPPRVFGRQADWLAVLRP